MHLIVVRHGETEENRKGIVQGQKKGSLSSLGKQQVHDTALLLKNDQLDAIYSSDLQRSVDTVIPITQYHKNAPLYYSTELREISIGKYDALPLRFPPRLANRGLRIAMFLNIKTPGGESWKSLRYRVGTFLNEIYAKHPNDTVLLVSHGITMRAIRSLLSDPREEKKLRKQDVPNCVVWRMEMEREVVI